MESKRPKITPVMNERCPETPSDNHSSGIPRDYPLRPMPFSNQLCPSGVGSASNMSASHYSSTASTSDNLSSSSYPSSSSPYLPVPPYPVSTSSYPANTNSTYPRCVSTYLASSNSRYPAASSLYHHVSSNNPYHASGSPYADSSNRHYPAPSSKKQCPSSFPYPSIGSRGYTSKFGPSRYVQKECQEAEIAALKQKLVDMEAKLMQVTAELEQVKNERAYDKINFETEKYELESKIGKYKDQCSGLQRENEKLQSENEKLHRYLQDLESSNIKSQVDQINDDACYINSLPNEIILKIFSYLTQNQLGQIARVCRKWSVLTKSPVLWKNVDVEIFCSSYDEEYESFKSLVDGLPSCVTFMRLDFVKRGYLFLEEFCLKLHQSCSQVETLILKRCGVPTNLPKVINSCTQFLQGLKKLVLHSCEFGTYSVTGELEDNSNIEVLNLTGSYFSPSRKIQFSKLRSLTELRLALTPVDNTWFVEDTSFLNHLQVLDLGWTYITASTYTAIQRHGQNLKELYLCNLNLEDHDFSFHNPVFPHLQTICLSGNFVTCESLVSLVRSCPSLVSVYVREDVARSFAEHPLVVANRCKLGIVKSIDRNHNHRVDYLHN